MNARWFFSSPALQCWVRKTKRFLARFSGLPAWASALDNPWLKPGRKGR